jgi:hypothetical protein
MRKETKRYILVLLFVCAAGVVSAGLNDDALGIFNDFLGRLVEKHEAMESLWQNPRTAR